MLKTLYDKLWESHVVHSEDDGTALLYIDRHLLHEVTSPQAFEGLKLANRQPWRISANLVVADHNVPTTNRINGIDDPVSRLQVETLAEPGAVPGGGAVLLPEIEERPDSRTRAPREGAEGAGIQKRAAG